MTRYCSNSTAAPRCTYTPMCTSVPKCKYIDAKILPRSLFGVLKLVQVDWV